jgi:predicted unusual protein kinase regulating ubiquinone biosynthesis (AarF/ABC1/UbiB family)
MNKNYFTLANCASKLKKINKTSKQEDKNELLEDLFSLFAREKGLFLKFGQFLNQHKETIDYTKISKIKILDLDKTLQSQIKIVCNKNDFTINSPVAFIGSIGLVIRVKTKSNNEHAIKIQYPNIEKNLMKQFSAISSLSSMAPSFLKLDMNNSGFLDGLRENINNELDYEKECKNTLRMKQGIKSSTISTLDPTLLESKVIKMNWIEGINLNCCSNISKINREFIATNLLNHFHNSFFNNGFIQVDNQEDNFIFDDKNKKIYLLDLGNCISIDIEKRIAIFKIIQSIQNQSNINYIPLLATIGFNAEKLVHIEDYLPPLLEAIFSPYCSNLKFDLKNYNINKIVENILGENKWWFRMAGNEEVFSMMRSFSLLLKTLSRLDIPLFFKMHLNKDLHEDFLTKADELTLSPGTKENYFNNTAKNLHLKVTENGIEKVFLSMPSTVLQDIENYINDDIRDRIIKEGISLEKIIQTAYKNKLQPQKLIHLQGDDKEVLIYLN